MTNTRGEAHAHAAKLVLAYEAGRAGSSTSTDWANAVARVYVKVFGVLAPIIGGVGVQALLSRSVTLAKRDVPALVAGPLPVGAGAGEAAKFLSASVAALSPSDANAAAVALYARFFGLLTTFIGGDLTAQLVRTAWPTLDITFKETK